MRKVLVATALLLLFATPGNAHEQSLFDKDDSHGPLDLVAVRQQHRVFFQTSSHPWRTRRIIELRYHLATFEKWDSEILSGGKNFIAIEFSFDAEPDLERCIVIKYGRYEPNIRFYKHCDYSNDDFVRVLSGSRRDKHSLVTVIDRHHLKKRIHEFYWRVVTSFEDPDAKRGEPCRSGSSTRKRYGACRDATEWRFHRL